MAHTFETIVIEGKKIKVAIGTYGNDIPGVSLTVNVYDQSNTEGCYEQVYRLPSGSGINASAIAQNVTLLRELEPYLMRHGASKEGPRKS
ncbi:MAG: hypothetical protein K8U03_07745 [Planctomycetia bacterium]|nr:hypothetical protein [Planctomycetia bacterium]